MCLVYIPMLYFAHVFASLYIEQGYFLVGSERVYNIAEVALLAMRLL